MSIPHKSLKGPLGSKYHISLIEVGIHLRYSNTRNTWFAPSTRVPTEQSQTRRSTATTSQQRRSLYSRLKLFFGYGPDASRTRKALVSVVWSLSYGLVQVCQLFLNEGLH